MIVKDEPHTYNENIDRQYKYPTNNVLIIDIHIGLHPVLNHTCLGEEKFMIQDIINNFKRILWNIFENVLGVIINKINYYFNYVTLIILIMSMLHYLEEVKYFHHLK